MYYPYFRGKQNELITIRDNAELLSKSNFIPIIEPVKSSLNGLIRALDHLNDANGKAILIVNPQHGDFSKDGSILSTLIESKYKKNDNISVGILLPEKISIELIIKLYQRHKGKPISFIHAGFSEGKELASRLGSAIELIQHVFDDNHSGKLYRKNFQSHSRVLIRDGFKKKINREYPTVEFFSDLHITYKEENVEGFGDFLIVGDEYSESGGPAYAIAIHLTCIDKQADEEIIVHHFISIRQDTPADPAGKFAEALNKLIAEVDKPNTNFYPTRALKEFRDFHDRQHFPGLGYVKKLSMQHHIETLATFLSK